MIFSTIVFLGWNATPVVRWEIQTVEMQAPTSDLFWWTGLNRLIRIHIVILDFASPSMLMPLFGLFLVRNYDWGGLLSIL